MKPWIIGTLALIGAILVIGLFQSILRVRTYYPQRVSSIRALKKYLKPNTVSRIDICYFSHKDNEQRLTTLNRPKDNALIDRVVKELAPDRLLLSKEKHSGVWLDSLRVYLSDKSEILINSIDFNRRDRFVSDYLRSDTFGPTMRKVILQKRKESLR